MRLDRSGILNLSYSSGVLIIEILDRGLLYRSFGGPLVLPLGEA